MIVNILDLRADHSAIGPIDAAVVTPIHGVDPTGILIVHADMWQGKIMRETMVTTAVEWASDMNDSVILLLLDAESGRTAEAERRMERKLERALTLLDLDILLPSEPMQFDEEPSRYA